MLIQTARFGPVEIDESCIIEFPAGVLEFTCFKRFALLPHDENGVFFWLQSIDSHELAFVVTDPALWIPDYRAPIRKEQMEELSLREISDAQVLVIVNRHGQSITVNLQGPLVINCNKPCRAMQLVVPDSKWALRHELYKIDTGAAAKTA